MTGNLDPGTATRAALGEEIDRLRESLGKPRFLDLYEDVAMAICDCSPDEDLFPLVTHGPQVEAIIAVVRPYLDGQAWTDITAQPDEARRDLAAATTALQRIRELADRFAEAKPVDPDDVSDDETGWIEANHEAAARIRAVLPAAGDGPATTGGETDGQ